MSKKYKNITFTDFCSGIGGGKIALENCLNFSEIDKNAEITYQEFFKKDEVNYGDLMQINPDDLPNFDFMIGGQMTPPIKLHPLPIIPNNITTFRVKLHSNNINLFATR